ncbi:MAG: hypothetical protein DCC65_09450 [Planctomycetota bacterium]|nr:MAG: hypothetical protein DCC65_09450 [Planctomycetota bacterium]
MKSNEEPSALRDFACELARLGGRTAGRLFGKVSVHRKADNSPVTDADHITQDAILRALSERYPDHAILVEETVADPGRHADSGASDFCWVVDPIDGTRNYARGVRVYATSVAVLHRGRTIAGAICDATNDAVYSASRGCGAFRDHDLIRIAEPPVARELTIAVGSFRRRPMPVAVKEWMGQYHVRNMGSTSLHLAWIAAGFVDAAYSIDCKLWDVAAAALIVEEAGGCVTTEAGGPLWPCGAPALRGEDLQILAGAKGIHQVLLKSLS